MRAGGWIVPLALGLAVLAAGGVAIQAYDFGWHLQAGRWILEHGGSPPRQDPLAHTTDGAAWVDHEWLFQVILAAAFEAGGLLCVWLLKQGLLLVSIALPAVVLARRGAPPALLALLGVLALEGARFRFQVRPELAGLALLPLLLLLLLIARARQDAGRSASPYLLPLPLLLAGWANLHPSCLLALAVIWLFAGVRQISSGSREASPFFLVALFSTLATLANPYGAALFEVPGAIAASLSSASVRNPEWGHGFRAEFALFWIVVAGLSAATGVAARRGRRPDGAALAILGLLAAGGAAALRLQGYFFVALPILGVELLGGRTPAPTRASAAGRRRMAEQVGVLAVLLAAAFFLARPIGGPLGTGLAPGRYPEGMAETYRRLDITGPIYNPVRFGGHLAWRLAPEKVFIDGRNEIHAGLLARLSTCRLQTDLACWDAIMEDHGVQAAFVEYDPRRITVRRQDGSETSMSAAAVYFRKARWALVDWDDVAMLYVRRGGANDAIVSSWEDKILLPDDPELLAADLAAGRLDAAAAAAEVERRLALRPAGERIRRQVEILRAHGVGVGLALDTGGVR